METKQVNIQNMLHKIQSKWIELTSKNKLSIIAATIVSLILSRTLYHRLSSKYNSKLMPDGPSGIPIFGSFFEIRRDSLQFYASLPLFYGPLSCFKFGSAKIISINDPIIARTVYINHNKSVINRYVTGVKHPIYHGFSLQNGKSWLQRRKIIQSQLLTITNSTFIDNVTRPILNKYIFAEFDKTKLVHTRQLFRNLTFCIIYCAIFGMNEHKKFEFNGDIYTKYNQYIQDIFESQPLSTEMTLLFGEKSFISKLIWNWSTSKKKFMKTVQKMCDMTLAKYLQIKAAKSNEVAMNKASFCEYICQYQRNQDSNGTKKIKYSDQDIAADINVMIEAGVDTTATTLEFAVLLATIYPDVQEEIYSELKSVFPDGYDGFKLESSKLHLLPKLRAYIHETLRLFPPSPQSFLRKIEKDINIDVKGRKYVLPKNSLCHLNIYAMNHNKKYWNNVDNIHDMNLSIWLDKETGHFVKHKSFTTFSISKRDCPGSSLAMRELLCVLGMLFLKYKFIGNEMGYKSAKDVKIKQAFNMTMDPECGILVERRK